MSDTRIQLVAAGLGLLAMAGCEGYDRSGPPPTDLRQSPEKALSDARRVNLADELERMRGLRDGYVEQLRAVEKAWVQNGGGGNAAGPLERARQSRDQYLTQLKRLEAVYLEIGDMARSSWAKHQRAETAAVVLGPDTRASRAGAVENWARRQRGEVEALVVYPYASDRTPEYSTNVRAGKSVPEADALYAQADGLIHTFRGVPLAGVLDFNKDKARRAIRMLRELITKYPRSDKVDDAAFWIGECYKEYLREEDPDNMLALRYYAWAIELDPHTPHPARFQAAVVYDFRLHDRKNALAMYHRVLNEHEEYHPTNPNFAAERIRQLVDDDASKERPREEPEHGRVVHAEAAGTTPDAEPEAARVP